MKKIYFLSGLPRSGSTVLAALLQQHPEMHTTATSGLLDMLVGTFRGVGRLFITKVQYKRQGSAGKRNTENPKSHLRNKVRRRRQAGNPRQSTGLGL
jgi:hypothetical protein